RQSDIVFDGHAIEARVIAEDPLAGFLPSSGTISKFKAPTGVRVDTWIRDGTRVSTYYDSLLAKVIAHAPTRIDAARRLGHALEAIRLEGVSHNIDLLLSTIETQAFLAGDLHTGFLEEHHLVEDLALAPEEAVAAVSALDF